MAKTSVTEPLVKHTPHGLGTLHVYTRTFQDGGQAYLAEATVRDAHDRSVVGLHIRPGRTDAQHLAAANLFAAAADLLDAARLAVEAIGNTRDEFGLKVELEKAYLALQAAIGKTEGGAQ